MGRRSDPWWWSFVTLHDLREYIMGGDIRTKLIVLSQPFTESMINPEAAEVEENRHGNEQ